MKLASELEQSSAGRIFVVEGEPAEITQLTKAVADHLHRQLKVVSANEDWHRVVALIPAAEEKGVILLFDEADSLFGKRGSVQDSHDRYADLETSFHGLIFFGVRQASNLGPPFLERARRIIARHYWP